MGLIQPILSKDPEPGHSKDKVLSFDEFLELLRKEEDYFEGEQHNTKLMITRLRKIFYDELGWNTQLIRKAAGIEGRYRVILEDCGVTPGDCSEDYHIFSEQGKRVRRYRDNKLQYKCRKVVYRENDKVYPDRAGQTPFIYESDHQDVMLPDGYHCDLGHVLAGLDALNNPQVVSPLSDFLFFLHKLFPHVGSNANVTTWLGDIASTSGDFLFHNLAKKPMDEKVMQCYIDRDASASDMLGNIDAFVINSEYRTGTDSGPRPTDIFSDYYLNTEIRKGRFRTFSKRIRLEWDGKDFSNEDEWLRYYSGQLKNNTAFQVFSLTENRLQRFVLPIKIVQNRYNKILCTEMLLKIFLEALKKFM